MKGNMPQQKMISQKDSEDAHKKKMRSELIEKIPVMAQAGNRRNKNLVKLKQDLEERARLLGKGINEVKAETMYVDATRNVGVVLGEKDLGKDIKKPGYDKVESQKKKF